MVSDEDGCAAAALIIASTLKKETITREKENKNEGSLG